MKMMRLSEMNKMMKERQRQGTPHGPMMDIGKDMMMKKKEMMKPKDMMMKKGG